MEPTHKEHWLPWHIEAKPLYMFLSPDYFTSNKLMVATNCLKHAKMQKKKKKNSHGMRYTVDLALA